MQFDKYIENYYPQLVSYELFEEARQAMQQRRIKKRVGRASVGNVNIFRHTARCGKCGESMFFMHNFGSGKKHYYYLSCRTNFEQNVKCSNRIRYDLAVQILFGAIHHAEMLKWLSEQTDEDKQQFGDYLYKTFKELDELSVSNGMLTLATAFLKIMSTSNEHKTYNTEIIEMEAELSKAKVRLENLERSAQSITDGNYPSILLKQLASAEESISILKEKREQYITNASTYKSDLNIETLKQFSNLFREETGRLEIINFLVSNGITFSFDYDKNSKKLTTTVHIDNKLTTTLYHTNDNTYLSEFGFKNLGEEFKLFD
jgi:hypothetical protein